MNHLFGIKAERSARSGFAHDVVDQHVWHAQRGLHLLERRFQAVRVARVTWENLHAKPFLTQLGLQRPEFLRTAGKQCQRKTVAGKDPSDRFTNSWADTDDGNRWHGSR